MNAPRPSRFDPELMRRQLGLLLVEPGDVVELRIIGSKGAAASGYFDNADAAIEAIRPWALDEHIDTIFVLLNPPKPACLRRYANRMQPASPRIRGEFPKETTSDADVAHRRWLLVDCDAERPAGVSASDEEREASRSLASAVYSFLKEQGISGRSLATMTSGNGFYVLVRVDLPNDEPSRALCENVLKGLRATLPGEGAHVDLKCFNAGRIAALCGTTKGKGDNLPDAPHRMVKPIVFPEAPTPAPIEALERVAALAPKPPKPPTQTTSQRKQEGPFDAAAWLARFPQVELLDGPVAKSGGWTRWYVRCPWNSDHAGKDAYLSVSPTGAVTYHCSHNSCAGHDWAALRALVGDNPPPRRERQPKPKVEIPADQIVTEPEEWRWTEVGNKERLLAAHGDVLRYDPARGWMVWDGRVWRTDLDAGLARRLCEQVLVAMAKTTPVQAALDEDLADEWKSWCKSSATARMVAAVLQLAQTDPRLRVEGEIWDRDLWAINCQNGILDLRTGQLRPHDREAYCTRITSCAYDPEATAPLWEACLERWQPSADVRAFLQRHAGYSLTGLTVEQTAVLHYGEGKNGKSKFTGAIRHVFGSYAGVVDHSALSDAKRGAGQANPEIARLVGLRFVLGSEIQQGVAFNEALIKDITGGDRVIARMLHSNPIEFDPQFALWLYGNHKPRIKSQDEGIWRRLPLVPWNVVIPPAERDAELDFKLKAEAPGILAWMVRGCQAWQQEGLNPPTEVIEASAKYRRDEDHFGQFAEAHLVFVEGAMTPSHDIRKAYEEWCDAEGFKPWTTKALGDSLARRGGRSDSKKVPGLGQTRVWFGVALASDRDDDDAPPEPADLEMRSPDYATSHKDSAPPVYTALHKPAAQPKPADEEADPFAQEAATTPTPARDSSALDVWVMSQFNLRDTPREGQTIARAKNLDELLERGEARGFGRQDVVSAANAYATQRAAPRDRAWWNQLQAQPRHPRVADTPESRGPSTSSDNPEDWADIEDPFAE